MNIWYTIHGTYLKGECQIYGALKIGSAGVRSKAAQSYPLQNVHTIFTSFTIITNNF